jgi:uncharacterized SAM-binding protein YcdF (DUF218 family)
MTGLLHLLLRLPLYVMILLTALAVAGYRAGPGTMLRKVRHLLAFAVVAVYLGSAPVVSNALTRYLEEQYPAPEMEGVGQDAGNVVLVLTAGSFRRTKTGYEARIGEEGWERLMAGLRLHAKIGGRLVFAGAPSPDGRSSIARSMADMARRFGVPDGQILVEERSTNTYENIAYSESLLDGLHGPVWLVTSALRMPRAMAVAAKQGIEVKAYPCDFRGDQRSTWWAWIPANHSTVALERNLHEIFGLLVYRIRKWA